MTWFLPFESFDCDFSTVKKKKRKKERKKRERQNRTVTVIFDPASVTAEFEVQIRRTYGETIGVNRCGTGKVETRKGEIPGSR